MKFAIGLFLGLGIASAAAQYPVIVNSYGGFIKVDKDNKVLSTLDAAELAKIKEACK